MTKVNLLKPILVTLTAKNVCRMDDGEKSLTIGKEYKIEDIRGTDIIIIDDTNEEHFYSLIKDDISYFKQWFRIKRK